MESSMILLGLPLSETTLFLTWISLLTLSERSMHITYLGFCCIPNTSTVEIDRRCTLVMHSMEWSWY